MANDLIDEIIDEIKTYANCVSKYSAINTRDIMYDTASKAIDYFYDTYTPGDYHARQAAYENKSDVSGKTYVVYHRTYNLKKSYKKDYKDNHGRTFTGGIILSPDFMADGVYHSYQGKDSRELVFDLAYAGLHGLDAWNQTEYRPSAPYYVTIPSPMKMITDKADKLMKSPSQYIINPAIERADKDVYTHLK